MTRKKLYRVQDPDRPMYVVAVSWIDALAKWKVVIAAENNQKVAEVTEPEGIQFVADADEIIL